MTVRTMFMPLAVVSMLCACGADVKQSNTVSNGGAQADAETGGRKSPFDAAVSDGSPDGGATTDGAGGDASVDAGEDTPVDAELDASAALDASATLDAAVPVDVDASAPIDAPPAAAKPVFVGVGYGGRRIRSTDLGKTWTDDVNLPGGGGDDPTLLRTVTFGKGLFVAAGHRIFTSPDGSANSWTERTNPNFQWFGGVELGNDRFVATGGYGYSAYSLDGITWMVGGNRSIEASRALAFGKGMFVSATDPGNWWTSSDGTSWTKLDGVHGSTVAFCNGDFHTMDACQEPFTAKGHAEGAGVTVRLAIGGIERSEDGGKTFALVPLTTGAPLEDLAFGYVN